MRARHITINDEEKIAYGGTTVIFSGSGLRPCDPSVPPSLCPEPPLCIFGPASSAELPSAGVCCFEPPATGRHATVPPHRLTHRLVVARVGVAVLLFRLKCSCCLRSTRILIRTVSQHQHRTPLRRSCRAPHGGSHISAQWNRRARVRCTAFRPHVGRPNRIRTKRCAAQETSTHCHLGPHATRRGPHAAHQI